MKEKEIKIFITLDSVKIQSINSMYKAGMIYKNGKPVPYIYKSAESKKVSDIMTNALRAIDWTEYIDWLKETPQFTVTQNYIFKSGISRRDTGNCEKLISDVLVKFIHGELGIESFDDSKFTDLHLYKSIIPGGDHEYICISIKPSMFNTRFDQLPKPSCVSYNFPKPDSVLMKDLKQAHKEKGIRFKFLSGEGNFRKTDTPDTEVLIINPTSPDFPMTLVDIFKRIRGLGDTRFLYLLFLENSPVIEELKEMSGVFVGVGDGSWESIFDLVSLYI